MKTDAVLLERPADEGFTKNEIVDLLDPLELEPDEQVDAIYLETENAIIFGFIRLSVSEKILSFETGATSAFGQAVVAVANNRVLERPDHLYDFAGVTTLMYY